MKIVIHSCSYEVSEPYEPGLTVLTEDEASILNSVRADRIRDVASKGFGQKHLSSAISRSKIPTYQEHSEFQRLISAYDSKYKLKYSQNTRMAPIDHERHFVAHNRVDVRIRQNNLELSDHDYQQLINLELGLPEVWEEARQRLLIQRQSLSSLEDLL